MPGTWASGPRPLVLSCERFMNHVLRHPGRSLSNVGAILVSLSLLVGCGILDEGNPEKIRVVMNGADGSSVQLITSDDFTVFLDEDGETRSVQINSADTTAVTSPFKRTYPLGSDLRFYLRVESEQLLTEPLTVRAFIDDEERFTGTSFLGDDFIEFTYTFW